MADTYQKPVPVFINRHEGTEKLYALEAISHQTFADAADELARVLHIPKTQFWTKTLPQALLAFLDSWDRQAVRVACEAWMEANPVDA